VKSKGTSLSLQRGAFGDSHQAGLFDEFRVALAPAVLGRGTPLFGRDLPQQRLKLLEARPLKSGVVILRYEPQTETSGAEKREA